MTQEALTPVLRLLRAAALAEQRLTAALSCAHGLSLPEATLLMHLEAEPTRRLTRIELSRRMHLSASTVTRMAAPMEKIGLVGRESDPRDARLAFVTLTEAGAERVADLRTTLAARAADLFDADWTAEEIAAFSGGLGRFLEGVRGELV